MEGYRTRQKNKPSALSVWYADHKMLAGAIVTGIILTAIFVGAWFLLPRVLAPSAEGGYSIKVIDGVTLQTLPSDDFDYTVYGTDDLGDFSAYDVIETGSGLSRVASSDLEDYAYYIIRFNGTVEEDEFDDGENDRTYYERWDMLDPASANTLIAYQQPGFGTFSAVFVGNGTSVTKGTKVIATQNISIVAYTNMSQEDAMYVEDFDYEDYEYVRPTFTIVYNATVTSTTSLNLPGTIKSQINSTAYSYQFTEIGATLLSFNAYWGSAATHHYCVSEISLSWGPATGTDILKTI